MLEGLIDGFLSALPEIKFEMPENIMDNLIGIFEIVCFLLPVKALLPILITSVTIDLAQIVIAIIIRIKSFIPTMGA